MKRFKYFLLWACLALHAQSSFAASIYDPALQWQTVSSPRFNVHYPDGARNLAIRILRESEAVIEDVEKLFGYAPESVIDIVLSDASDLANGSAQVLPRNIIRLYLTAPTELTGLSSYDDWIRILLIHEIAHICDIDQTWWATRFLRYIFGKYIQMNGFTPQFLSEGAGVYAETLLTPTGRGRSSYVEMILRTAAISDNFVEIDQAHIQYSDWPGPSAAYFYGGKFHLWLQQRYGQEAVLDLHKFNAAMPLPYLYLPGALYAFGSSLPTLWQQWRDEVHAEAVELHAALDAQGITESRAVTTHGRNITGIRYSPDGTYIIYSRTSPVDGSTVRRVERSGENDRDLVLETFSARFSFAADGKRFLFSQNAINERFNNFNDLYLFDVESEKSTRLRAHDNPDKSLRARDPDFSPDGQSIVFVRNKLHQSWVEIGTVVSSDNSSDSGSESGSESGSGGESLNLRVLVPPQGDMQHASPRFSPDGKRVAISTWFPGGKRDIVMVDTESGELLRRVTNDVHLDGNPAWSPDGRYLLYESDADGISNIYAFDTHFETYHRVTRVFGGAFQADVSPDGAFIIFRNASGRGFDIHEMPFAPESWEPLRYDPENGYALAVDFVPPQDDAWGQADWAPSRSREQELPLPLAQGATAEGPQVDEREAGYSPWSSVLPFNDNWVLMPALFFFGDDPSARLVTLGQDALAEHTWALSAGTSQQAQHLNWSATYINDQAYPTVSAGYSDQAVTYATTRAEIISERDRVASAGISLPLRRRHLLGLSYAYALTEPRSAASEDFLRYGESKRAARLQFGYSYHFARRYPYSVGAEDGVSASIAGRWYSSALGGDFDELMLMIDGRAFVNNPLFDNHVLALRFVSAVAFGPDYAETFVLGGEHGASLFTVSAERSYPMRGFAPGGLGYPRGTGLLAGYMEYRFPLLHVERGLWTLPFFLERLHGGIFVEGGNTFGNGSESDLSAAYDKAVARMRGARVGAGGELRADVSLGWAFPLTLRLGVGVPVLDGGRPSNSNALIYLSFGSAI